MNKNKVSSKKTQTKNSSIDFALFFLLLIPILLISYTVYYLTSSFYFSTSMAEYKYAINNSFKEKVFNNKYETTFDEENHILRLKNMSIKNESTLSKHYQKKDDIYKYSSSCKNNLCEIEIQKK